MAAKKAVRKTSPSTKGHVLSAPDVRTAPPTHEEFERKIGCVVFMLLEYRRYNREPR